ncbi:VOC family protein [Acinetobacter gerneri]|uniref:VOC family protein n=1 Tax=Acinetobacter gerneri TaxID=202952 RepID=UPI003A89535D
MMEQQADVLQFEVKIQHGGISVKNIDETIAWYEKMLGFELETKQYIEQIPAYIAFIRSGDFRIELFELENVAALPEDRKYPHLDLKTQGHKHLCFAVQDAVQAFKQLREKGADIVFENIIHGTPMGFLRDNNGNLLELIQFPELWQNKER